MQRFLRFVLARQVLLNLVFVLLMIMGAYAFLTMPMDRYPDVNMGKIIITTVYPGASPEEVEALVTRKIEDALDDLKNVEFMRSTSMRQRSKVVIKLLDDTDYQAAYDEARFKVLSILDELPAEADPPDFNLLSVDDWLPVVAVDLWGDRSNRSLSLIAKELKVAIRQVQGVKEVRLQGEKVREFHVLVDPGRLAQLGVTFDQVARALSGANVSIPAGDFTTKGGDFVIRADERFRTRHQVMDAIIRTDADGSFLRVGDVATGARLDYRDAFMLSSVNGRDCVTLWVIKTWSGNAISIKDAVEQTVARFRPVMEREGVKVVLTRDTTVNIKDSINTLGLNMLVGISLVCLAIWYFMGFKNALVTTVGIPFSFLFTMIFMKLTGNSLNEITLFSFVLVSGIIVDDAIVVVENIYRHVQEGEPVGQAVITGTAEVFWPVVSATLTTISAFLPMLIMTGSTGEFFALIPKAVSFALGASLLECLIILPLHYRDWGSKKGLKSFDVDQEDFSGDGPVLGLIRRLVFKLLPRALKRPFMSLGLMGIAFVCAMLIAGLSLSGAVPLIEVKFYPDDYSLYYVQVQTPVGTPIEKTGQLLKKIERFVIKGGPGEAASAKGLAGFMINEDYEPLYGSNLGHVAVTFPAKGERSFDDAVAFLDAMRKRLKPFAKDGVKITVRPEKDGPPAGKDLTIRVVGPNPDSVHALSRDVFKFLRSDPAFKGKLSDMDDGRGQPSRVLRFKVQNQRAAENKITPAQAVGLASAVLAGRYVGKFRLQDEDVDFKLKLDPKLMRDPARALSVPLLEHPSGPVRLGDLVRMEFYQDRGDLLRFQGERAMSLTANILPGAGLSVPQAVAAVGRHYRNAQTRYPGASLSFAGEFESTRRSYTSLSYAFLIALLLIYLILATQFSSYLQPVIILSAVVFALTGVVFGKLFTQSLFTINSFIAIVGVAGVVVNDALVLIDFLNRRFAATGDIRAAVDQAVHIRLRPILLTTITTTLGLLPMALGIPSYSIVWGSMASTFVTGLCTATALTLVLVPVQWVLMQKAIAWRERRKLARQRAPR